jgi:hypothetical protein
MTGMQTFSLLDVLRVLISGAAGGIAVWLLMRASRAGQPIKARGVRRLHFAWPVRWTALLMLPCAAGVGYAASFAPAQQQWIASLVAVVFICVAVYLAYAVFLVEVYWTPDGIGSRDSFRGDVFVHWDDVVDAGYVASLQAFYVTDGLQKVWYSPMHAGVPQLHRLMRRRFAVAAAGPATATNL